MTLSVCVTNVRVVRVERLEQIHTFTLLSLETPPASPIQHISAECFNLGY
jgi:hypothetical protein